MLYGIIDSDSCTEEGPVLVPEVDAVGKIASGLHRKARSPCRSYYIIEKKTEIHRQNFG